MLYQPATAYATTVSRLPSSQSFHETILPSISKCWYRAVFHNLGFIYNVFPSLKSDVRETNIYVKWDPINARPNISYLLTTNNSSRM